MLYSNENPKGRDVSTHSEHSPIDKSHLLVRKSGIFPNLIMKEYLTLKKRQILKGNNIWDKGVLLEMNLIVKIYILMIIVATLLHALKALSCRDGSVLLHVMK